MEKGRNDEDQMDDEEEPYKDVQAHEGMRMEA